MLTGNVERSFVSRPIIDAWRIILGYPSMANNIIASSLSGFVTQIYAITSTIGAAMETHPFSKYSWKVGVCPLVYHFASSK